MSPKFNGGASTENPGALPDLVKVLISSAIREVITNDTFIDPSPVSIDEDLKNVAYLGDEDWVISKDVMLLSKKWENINVEYWYYMEYLKGATYNDVIDIANSLDGFINEHDSVILQKILLLFTNTYIDCTRVNVWVTRRKRGIIGQLKNVH